MNPAWALGALVGQCKPVEWSSCQMVVCQQLCDLWKWWQLDETINQWLTKSHVEGSENAKF